MVDGGVDRRRRAGRPTAAGEPRRPGSAQHVESAARRRCGRASRSGRRRACRPARSAAIPRSASKSQAARRAAARVLGAGVQRDRCEVEVDAVSAAARSATGRPPSPSTSHSDVAPLLRSVSAAAFGRAGSGSACRCADVPAGRARCRPGGRRGRTAAWPGQAVVRPG